MNTKQCLAAAVMTLLVLTTAPLTAATPEESFRKSFPQIPMDSIRPTDIPGLYEIVSGSRIIYYAPGPEYLIVGAILTRDGKNLTQERNKEILVEEFQGPSSRKGR